VEPWTLRAAAALQRSPAAALVDAAGVRASAVGTRISSAAGRREYERKERRWPSGLGVGAARELIRLEQLVNSSAAGRWVHEQEARRLGVL
jgi:hypothetical protein